MQNLSFGQSNTNLLNGLMFTEWGIQWHEDELEKRYQESRGSGNLEII